jgi:hypothetical protein
MQLAAVFCLHAGDTDNTPHSLFSSNVAQEHGEQLGHIETIRLRPTVTAIDFNARRVHHEVLHPRGDPAAVEPEPIPAGLVTTNDAGVLGSSNTPLGPGNLLT